MIFPGTRIALGSPPRIAFSNLVAGATTATFELPAGVGEVQFTPVDPNNPGVLTLTIPTDNTGAALTSSNSYTLTLNTGLNGIPGFGSAYFQTLGGKLFSFSTTAAAQSIVIYWADQIDGE